MSNVSNSDNPGLKGSYKIHFSFAERYRGAVVGYRGIRIEGFRSLSLFNPLGR